MPYTARKSVRCPSSKPWGVFKEGEDKPLGCHETKEAAVNQIGAIESQEKRGER